MRKVVIVLLIVVSLVASLSVVSSAYYYGWEDGSPSYVPIPKEVMFWYEITPVYFSDSPFCLTDDVFDGFQTSEVHNYMELYVDDIPLGAISSYTDVTFDGVQYLEYSIDFDGSSFPGLLFLPIMNNSDLPLLYRVYLPGSDYLSFSIIGTGYNIVDGDLVSENFSFEVSTDSDEYINSTIAQMPLSYPDMSEEFDFIQLDIPFEGEFARISLLYPLDSEQNSIYHTVDLTDIDVEVIEAPSFLNWLTRSVSAFLDTRIFSLGSVSVTLGVCLLVPLSLYFLVAFLKKFSGG